MLNDAEGASLYRLPTEAEWEYAGRAGTTTRWSWGDDPEVIADYAWYRDNTYFSGEAWAHPVGLKLPNPWNLYDMHGNAWEWVQDWSALYQDGAQVDPKGPDEGTYRIVRGGVGARLVRQDPAGPGTSVQSSSWGRVKKDDAR